MLPLFVFCSLYPCSFYASLIRILLPFILVLFMLPLFVFCSLYPCSFYAPLIHILLPFFLSFASILLLLPPLKLDFCSLYPCPLLLPFFFSLLFFVSLSLFASSSFLSLSSSLFFFFMLPLFLSPNVPCIFIHVCFLSSFFFFTSLISVPFMILNGPWYYIGDSDCSRWSSCKPLSNQSLVGNHYLHDGLPTAWIPLILSPYPSLLIIAFGSIHCPLRADEYIFLLVYPCVGVHKCPASLHHLT